MTSSANSSVRPAWLRVLPAVCGWRALGELRPDRRGQKLFFEQEARAFLTWAGDASDSVGLCGPQPGERLWAAYFEYLDYSDRLCRSELDHGSMRHRAQFLAALGRIVGAPHKARFRGRVVTHYVMPERDADSASDYLASESVPSRSVA